MRWTYMVIAPALCLFFVVGSTRAVGNEAAAKAAFAKGKTAFAGERFTEAAEERRKWT